MVWFFQHDSFSLKRPRKTVDSRKPIAYDNLKLLIVVWCQCQLQSMNRIYMGNRSTKYFSQLKRHSIYFPHWGLHQMAAFLETTIPITFFLDRNLSILIAVSLKGPIHRQSSSAQVVAWRVTWDMAYINQSFESKYINFGRRKLTKKNGFCKNNGHFISAQCVNTKFYYHDQLCTTRNMQCEIVI